MIWVRETRAKQERRQDNDVTRIKAKGKNKGIDKVKARCNGTTMVQQISQKYMGKDKWKEKGKDIEMRRWEEIIPIYLERSKKSIFIISNVSS